MKANILSDGRYEFMKSVTFPLEVEAEISEMGNLAVTPEQLQASGVEDVPDRFCAEVWYFTIPTEAVIIKENSNADNDK